MKLKRAYDILKKGLAGGWQWQPDAEDEDEYPRPGGEADVEQMRVTAAYNEAAKEKFLAWKRADLEVLRDQWRPISCPTGAIPVSELDKQLEEWREVCRVNEEAPEVEEAMRAL